MRAPSRPTAYGLAVLAAAGATLFRLFALGPVLGDRAPLLPLPLAVLLAAWIGGLGPGLLATAISFVGALAFTVPRGELTSPHQLALYAVLLATCIAISVICESMLRARRRAEAANDALRASEQRFRLLADAAPILIWMSDTTKACTWFNRAWLEFTGRTMEQEIGDGWAEGVHPDDLARCLQIYTSSFDARQPFEMDYRLRRSDGTWRWMLDRGTPMFEVGGGFTGYMGGCVDIHDRKEAEHASAERLREEQAARAEAERVALLKDDFLATVSHEMRTPLTAILGWSQLLRKGMLEGEHVSQAVETIERNARTQAQLIEDLLDMSRILSGRMRLDVRRVRLHEVITAALEAARPAAAAKRIAIATSLASDLPPVAGDPIRLQQVAWNLINNAVKFTPEGGRVTVTLAGEPSHAELSIADTGEGIPANFLPHVFDRFRQANAGSARRHGGLGLGLAIVKQLVELHGGTALAESDGPGLGARFTIRLPLAPPEAPTPTAPTREERPASPAHGPGKPSLKGADILVVDDDGDTRKILRTILEQTGATVRTAASAAEALAAAQERAPMVLVSDIGMPDEDGYSLIRKVRALPACSRTPAIALTAFSRTEDRHRALLAGFQMHLPKPVEAAELVVLVSSLLRR